MNVIQRSSNTDDDSILHDCVIDEIHVVDIINSIYTCNAQKSSIQIDNSNHYFLKIPCFPIVLGWKMSKYDYCMKIE